MAAGRVRILFIGDIVGGIGRRAVEALLPALRERLEPTFVIANGENAAGGTGITPKVASRLFESGIDVLTLGNHAYRHREVYPYLDEEPRILRPANYLRSQPGHGWCVVNHGDLRLGVVSISGNLLMNAGKAAFPEADAVLHALA
ncbi:MAG: YmdB family metallophosphoesterase, partial [Solirubrobacteraceae bacterium]